MSTPSLRNAECITAAACYHRPFNPEGIDLNPAGESIETVVIGAGQAGLSTSYWLRARGLTHLVLERGRVGETWRSQRWDGFYLNTPRWANRLPGFHDDGLHPDEFPSLREV